MTQYTVIDGVAYPVATSAPAAPAVASPFAAASIILPGRTAASAETSWPVELQGLDRKSRKRTAAVLALPGWSCTVEATYAVPGEDAPRTGALHGTTFPVESGTPCKGVSNRPDGQTICSGTYR